MFGKLGPYRVYGELNAGKPSLNVVLARKEFNHIGHFAAYCESVLRTFDKPGHVYAKRGEPHVLLFAETPFPEDYYPSRLEVGAVVRGLRNALQQTHKNFAIAFSINEAMQPRSIRPLDSEFPRLHNHSNTGYLITSKGIQAYSKILAAEDYDDKRDGRHSVGSDEDAIKRYAGSSRPEVNDVLAIWTRRGERFARRAKPFPEHEFDSGHLIHFRVCRDAYYENAVVPHNAVALISAHGLRHGLLRPVASQAKLVVVNDARTDGFGGRRLIFGNYVASLEGREGEVQPGLSPFMGFLKEHRIRLHVLG